MENAQDSLESLSSALTHWQGIPLVVTAHWSGGGGAALTPTVAQYNSALAQAQNQLQDQPSHSQLQALTSSLQAQTSGLLGLSSLLGGVTIVRTIATPSTEPKLSPYSMLMWRTQRPLWRFILATGLWRHWKNKRS